MLATTVKPRIFPSFKASLRFPPRDCLSSSQRLPPAVTVPQRLVSPVTPRLSVSLRANTRAPLASSRRRSKAHRHPVSCPRDAIPETLTFPPAQLPPPPPPKGAGM